MKKTLFLLSLALLACVGICSAQTLPKGNVTQIMNGGRILDWKEITAADLPLYKDQGTPFSIFLAPKSNTNTTEFEIVQLRGYQADTIKEVPLVVSQWNVIAALYFPVQTINTTLFTNYRVFVGYGQTIN